MITDVDELRGRFLEWLYEQGGTSTTVGIEVAPFMVATGIDLAAALSLVGDAAERGLARDWSGMGSPCAVLTLGGIRAAQERQRIRADPPRRAAAARTGLLRWLYEQEHVGARMPVIADVLATDHATLLGARLSDTEIDRAAQYLTDKKLINGGPTAQTQGPVRVSLTSEGRDCIEHHGGNVTGYLNDRDRAGQTYNIGTFNNTGAAAFGGGDAHQQVSADLAVIAAFAQMLLARLPGLPMDDEHQAATRMVLGELQQELDQPDPEGGRITRALGRVVEYVTDAGKPALTALLLALAQQHGLPPS